MNTQRMTRVMLAGAVALALAALTFLLVALPATAGPETQDDWTPIPTPTLYPLPPEGIEYVLKTVGGDDSPQVFNGETVESVTFGETLECCDPLTLQLADVQRLHTCHEAEMIVVPPTSIAAGPPGADFAVRNGIGVCARVRIGIDPGLETLPQ